MYPIQTQGKYGCEHVDMQSVVLKYSFLSCRNRAQKVLEQLGIESNWRYKSSNGDEGQNKLSLKRQAADVAPDGHADSAKRHAADAGEPSNGHPGTTAGAVEAAAAAGQPENSSVICADVQAPDGTLLEPRACETSAQQRRKQGLANGHSAASRTYQLVAEAAEESEEGTRVNGDSMNGAEEQGSAVKVFDVKRQQQDEVCKAGQTWSEQQCLCVHLQKLKRSGYSLVCELLHCHSSLDSMLLAHILVNTILFSACFALEHYNC